MLSPSELDDFGYPVHDGYNWSHVVALLFLVWLFWGARFLGKRRHQRDASHNDELAKLARERGWSFEAYDTATNLASRFHCWPFRHFFEGRATAVVSGSLDGYSFTAFDYRFVMGEPNAVDEQPGHDPDFVGADAAEYVYGFTTVQLPERLPPMHVVPKRLARKFLPNRNPDIKREEFNRLYAVRADDRKFATDILNPRTVEVLLAAGRQEWRVQDDALLCWSRGPNRATDVATRVELLTKIARNIPTFVWTAYRYQPAKRDATLITGGSLAYRAVPPPQAEDSRPKPPPDWATAHEHFFGSSDTMEPTTPGEGAQ